jgi:hypothetical protein
MGLLSQKLTFSVPSSVEQTREKLRAKVKPGRLLVLEGDDPLQPFRGEVKDGSFQIVRRRILSNSFEPVLSGQLEAGAAATTVALTLEPHLMMISLIAAWTLIASGCAALLALNLELSPLELLALLLIPLFGPAVAVVAFRLAVPTAVQALKSILAP